MGCPQDAGHGENVEGLYGGVVFVTGPQEWREEDKGRRDAHELTYSGRNNFIWEPWQV